MGLYQSSLSKMVKDTFCYKHCNPKFWRGLYYRNRWLAEMEDNRKKPKGPKFFHPSNSSCLPICFLNIQSFLSFISAFVNPVSFDLTFSPSQCSSFLLSVCTGECHQGERRGRERGWLWLGSLQPRGEACHSRGKGFGER